MPTSMELKRIMTAQRESKRGWLTSQVSRFCWPPGTVQFGLRIIRMRLAADVSYFAASARMASAQSAVACCAGATQPPSAPARQVPPPPARLVSLLDCSAGLGAAPSACRASTGSASLKPPASAPGTGSAFLKPPASAPGTGSAFLKLSATVLGTGSAPGPGSGSPSTTLLQGAGPSVVESSVPPPWSSEAFLARGRPLTSEATKSGACLAIASEASSRAACPRRCATSSLCAATSLETASANASRSSLVIREA
mmetsp:Transcript_77831/g.241176  ORF Transcript_77831/g.241176 Transcript_77831/m.241176 type:complete len:254 (+) Transcript_77831:1137-1898(+)